MKIKVQEVQGLTIDQKHYKYGEITEEISSDVYALIKRDGTKHSVVSENKSAESKPVETKPAAKDK